MSTLVEKLSNCCHYFLRLSGFPDLSSKVFLITFEFPSLDYSTLFCNNNVNKTVFLDSSKYREIITAKTVTHFSIKSLKSKKKKLGLTFFYYVIRELWLANSKKLICVDQSRFYIFSQPRELKNVRHNFKIFFNNKHLKAE